MQFEVSKSSIFKALSIVNGAVERRNTIPILQNIKIDVAKEGISLSATDMDIAITTKFTANVINEGSTTVPAQILFDIIRKISDQNIIFLKEEESNLLQIKQGKSKYNLPTIDSDQFPNIVDNNFEKNLEVDSAILIKMFDKTRFAISNDETRYYLNGLFFQLISKEDDAKEIRCVSTDGHKLALSYHKIDKQEAKNDCSDFGIIIPKKSVVEIKKILETSSRAKISISNTKVQVENENSIIVSKLIDGDYPDYNRVLPKGNNKTVIVKVKDFYDAVDRVSTIATDKHRSLKVSIDNSFIKLNSDTNDGGSAYEEVKLSSSDANIETGFNSKFLLEILSHVEKDELIIKFKDGNSPAIIEADAMNAMFVLMPIKV